MKINCQRQDFLEGVRVVQNALTSITLPILSHILMTARGERVNLAATNLETTIQASFPSQVLEEGEICLPGNKLFQILRELPPLGVSLTTEDTKAAIKCEKSLFHLLGLEAAEFPEIPKLEEGKEFTLAREKLKEMIQKTIFAASLDETRQNLNGVHLEIEEKEIKMVATDGRRLAFIRASEPSLELAPVQIIIPLRALQQLLRVMEKGEEVRVGAGKSQIFFRMENILLISQLIEAKFPDYREVIPKEHKITIMADRNELLAASKRVALLAEEKSRLLKFKLKENLLSISAISPETGSAYEELMVKREGEGDIQIGFNSTYLLDVLKIIDSGEVSLELTDSVSPGVIRPAESKDYIYVIMPIRTEKE
ncbi:DNA polymerase III subunit beta [Candidatus Aerophobetes bacterium]|uniref:Beta sliding clamp n=1 Tax=Aerophobetes bacterium TaxID=2030807 RepID=A0A523UQM9_UNCAE|nr:MAG: DNA polymerase III subunit beta [Candidatus Aerophobetes bacterium]